MTDKRERKMGGWKLNREEENREVEEAKRKKERGYGKIRYREVVIR